VTIVGSDSLKAASRDTKLMGSDSVTAAGEVSITAPSVTINAGMIKLNAAMVTVTGVVQCTTLISTSVVSSSYTPGAGNLV
jgi:hypothetical protein